MNAELPETLFCFCPRCGDRALSPRHRGLLVCAACDLHFHINAAAAVAALIFNHDNELLLIERLHEPARGLLDLPGGFVNYMESAENALRREVFEETNLTLDSLSFLCSFPNQYDYRGIRYHTVDLFFLARAQDLSVARPTDEASAIVWRAPRALTSQELAFDSVRRVLAYIASLPSSLLHSDSAPPTDRI